MDNELPAAVRRYDSSWVAVGKVAEIVIPAARWEEGESVETVRALLLSRSSDGGTAISWHFKAVCLTGG